MKAKDMYKDSPTLERDEESGKMRQGKKKDEHPVIDAGAEEGIPHAARHAMERLHMHAKHEQEHHAHDHGKHGDKKEMHGRHQKEMSDMHKKHEKELGAGEKK